MSLVNDRNSTPSAPPPWGILATVAWLLFTFLASLLIAAAVFGVWQFATQAGPRSVSYDGVAIAIGTLVSVPVQIAVLAFAAHLRRWMPRDYLALGWPRRGEIVFAVICVVALDLVFDAMLYITGRDLVPP